MYVFFVLYQSVSKFISVLFFIPSDFLFWSCNKFKYNLQTKQYNQGLSYGSYENKLTSLGRQIYN